MITWEDRKSFYNEEYYVEHGHYVTKDGQVDYDPESLKQGAEILYNLTKCKSVLDCGCAVGYLLRGFNLFDPNIRLNGVEISKFAVENAIPEIRDFIKVCDVSESLPFENDSFDLVTGFDILEHQQDYERLVKSVKEFCRVSRQYIFLRQPMVGPLNNDTILELNVLPHRARLELIDVNEKIYSAKPSDTNMEHPMTHPIKFWVALFESYGFMKLNLPEEILIFDNPLHLHSLNALFFGKEY